MRRIGVGLAVLCVAAAGIAVESGPGEPKNGVDALMNRKVSSAQAILEGLALEDYDALKHHGQQLRLLSQDVGWNILQTSDYMRISVEFRKAAEQIQAAGQRKNLDSAGLGYVKLTMACIDCHRHVRSSAK